jgi:hypothetical protein
MQIDSTEEHQKTAQSKNLRTLEGDSKVTVVREILHAKADEPNSSIEFEGTVDESSENLHQ